MTIGRISLLAASVFLWGCQGGAAGTAGRTAVTAPFAVARVNFEQNATDGDTEVVFEVKGNEEGLAHLTVTGPDGREVIDFTAPEASTLGIRQFRFESPEPGDAPSLATAYPEGVYVFRGVTVSSARLRGESTLSHRLPPPTAFQLPGTDARDVPVDGPVIAWAPVEDVTAYIVYIEQDELDLELTVRLPGSVTRFVVPDGVLLPGTTYQLGIGTVTGEGNASFVETTMTTARGKDQQ